MVSSKAGKDVIRVFDSRKPTECLWHAAGKHGLRGAEPSLAMALEDALEKARDTDIQLAAREK